MYIYILIYRYCLYHVAFGNFVPSAVLFSLQICNFYWFVFVRRCVLCLMFTIQHILKIFFLSKFIFESLTILSVAVFITTLPSHFRANLLLFVKDNSPESSSNKAWIRKFCKHLSIYPYFFRYAQEKQFG